MVDPLVRRSKRRIFLITFDTKVEMIIEAIDPTGFLSQLALVPLGSEVTQRAGPSSVASALDGVVGRLLLQQGMGSSAIMLFGDATEMQDHPATIDQSVRLLRDIGGRAFLVDSSSLATPSVPVDGVSGHWIPSHHPTALATFLAGSLSCGLSETAQGSGDVSLEGSGDMSAVSWVDSPLVQLSCSQDAAITVFFIDTSVSIGATSLDGVIDLLAAFAVAATPLQREYAVLALRQGAPTTILPLQRHEFSDRHAARQLLQAELSLSNGSTSLTEALDFVEKDFGNDGSINMVYVSDGVSLSVADIQAVTAAVMNGSSWLSVALNESQLPTFLPLVHRGEDVLFLSMFAQRASSFAVAVSQTFSACHPYGEESSAPFTTGQSNFSAAAASAKELVLPHLEESKAFIPAGFQVAPMQIGSNPGSVARFALTIIFQAPAVVSGMPPGSTIVLCWANPATEYQLQKVARLSRSGAGLSDTFEISRADVENILAIMPAAALPNVNHVVVRMDNSEEVSTIVSVFPKLSLIPATNIQRIAGASELQSRWPPGAIAAMAGLGVVLVAAILTAFQLRRRDTRKVSCPSPDENCNGKHGITPVSAGLVAQPGAEAFSNPHADARHISAWGGFSVAGDTIRGTTV